MSDEPDYVTVLHRTNGRAFVALMRYSRRLDAYEPVRMSGSFTDVTDAQALAAQWARNCGVECRL